MLPAGYRQIDHTADLALELWAPNEQELLVVGAFAVTDIMTDGATVSTDAIRPVRIEAVDAEDRLVQWLNEIIVAAVVDGFLVGDAWVELRNNSLIAELRGEHNGWSRIVTELKSATYHDLVVDCGDLDVRARVVIDV
ncbi:MAG: archease [Proteobacteria bacterium]|nr:archease [Pseudomonadota bacterium]